MIEIILHCARNQMMDPVLQCGAAVEACKQNLNLPRKNLTNEAKLDDSSSSTCEKMKISRRIGCKARRSQVNPMLRKPEASRD